jgi:basic membrane lipoprotein Med (substrate-binding protein (PBP1-ABC) superfamily)
MYKIAFFAGALMMAASPSVAQAPAQPAQAKDVATTDTSDVNKVVCKREESLGSRLSAKKVCLTVKQWQEIAEADRDQTEGIQRQAGVRKGN